MHNKLLGIEKTNTNKHILNTANEIVKEEATKSKRNNKH